MNANQLIHTTVATIEVSPWTPTDASVNDGDMDMDMDLYNQRQRFAFVREFGREENM